MSAAARISQRRRQWLIYVPNARVAYTDTLRANTYSLTDGVLNADGTAHSRISSRESLGKDFPELPCQSLTCPAVSLS
jgi:hypothetical protein